MRYLDAKTAAAVDEMLMGPEVDYTLEQLMELAGLAVAQVVRDFCPDKKTVTVVAGPGNNGGDGLVAARHLDLFGYKVSVLEPKPGRKEHFSRLRRQLEWTGVTFVSSIPSSEVIVDAIFGFSFKGDVRDPFRELIEEINRRDDAQIVCVDVPSGWDIDGKELPPDAIRVESPDCVISLTAPKV